jgi:hypothetical protein
MGGLTEYLRSIQNEPFSWAGHNCMSFVSGALRAMGRDGLPDEWCSGYDSTRRAVVAYKRCLATYGYPDIIAAMDDRFEPVETLHPRSGMICARQSDDVLGYAFGVVCGYGCAHLSEAGIVWSEPQLGDLYWRAS